MSIPTRASIALSAQEKLQALRNAIDALEQASNDICARMHPAVGESMGAAALDRRADNMVDQICEFERLCAVASEGMYGFTKRLYKEAADMHNNDSMEAYDKAYDAIHQRIVDEISGIEDKSELNMRYSAYDLDDRGVPVDNLDQVVAHGAFIVEYESDWSGVNHKYRSAVVYDPTWLDLAVIAHSAVLFVDDGHHIFLEAAHIKRQPASTAPDTVKAGIIELWFGS